MAKQRPRRRSGLALEWSGHDRAGPDDCRRRRRGHDPRRHLLRAAAGRSPARTVRRWADGVGAAGGTPAGPRDPRHRRAADGRAGALPPAARALRAAADHLRDLARRGVRPRPRPRARRRRLLVQTVLDARADGTRQGAAAPRQPGRRCARRGGPHRGGGGPRGGPASPLRHLEGERGTADRHRVPAAAGAGPAARAWCVHASS